MSKTKKNLISSQWNQIETPKERAKVYGYTRVSTMMQKDDGVSLETQYKKIVDLCSYKNYDLARVYQDVISGGDIDRPELEKLREIVKCGDAVIICDLSRLSRNSFQALGLLKEFTEKKVRLICLNPDIDFSTPSGGMMFTVLVATHELERRNISVNVKTNMQRISKEGKLRGVPPFGWKFIGKNKDYEEVESQQETIKWIIKRYNEEKTCYSIAQELNKTGRNKVLMDNKPVDTIVKEPKFYAETIKRILIDHGIIEDKNGERKKISDRIISYHKKEGKDKKEGEEEKNDSEEDE